MNRWPVIKLKSVTTKVGSGSTPRGGKTVYKQVGVPLIRSMNVHFDGFRSDGLAYIDDKEASLLGHVEVKHGDVLFNITGASIGRVTTAPKEMAGARVNQHVCIIRPTDELMPQFLSYYLRSPKQQALVGSNQIGGTREAITKAALLNWEVPLPPLREQEQIVRVLDEADELRKLRIQADRRTADLTSALFHEMFGDPVANDCNWERKPFCDLLDGIDNGWSPTCHDRPAGSNEWGVLKLSSVTNCHYLDTENKALPEDSVPRPELEVKAGDLLFTRKNTYELVAACAFVFKTRPKLMLSDLIFRFRLKPKVPLDPVYLWKLLTFPSKRKQVQVLAGGSAGSMPNISKGRLLTLSIEVPPLPLQNEFAARVDEIRSLEAAHTNSRHHLNDLFNSLLHRAFEGEL